MAAPRSTLWTVLILAENRELIRVYGMEPSTKLLDVMDNWMRECDQAGYWVFVAANGENEYDERMTLQMVGETVPDTGVVHLRARLTDKPTTEIFGFFDGRCHQLDVEPSRKLHEFLRRFRRGHAKFEYNGALLDLNEAISDTGLQNKALFFESQRHISINVKLSHGETKIFQVPKDGFVLDLYERVKLCETGDFSLTCQMRHLHLQESVCDLKQMVLVTKARFVVHISGHCVSWTARSEPMAFSEFLSQLSIKGDLDENELETMDFFCAGCQRRISNCDGYVQQMSIECCREKSRTLIARPHSEKNTQLEPNGIIQSIHNLNEQFVNFKLKNSRKVRIEAGKTKEALLKNDLNYNTIAEGCKRSINELFNKLKALEDENLKIVQEMKRLNDENIKNVREVKNLKDKNLKCANENKMLAEIVTALTDVGPNTTPIKAPTESPAVKLLVTHPADLSPIASLPYITYKGKYPWTAKAYHIKCVMPMLSPGWASFEKVRDAVQTLFTGRTISKIAQLRGTAHGRIVAAVTCHADDEFRLHVEEVEFCSDDGQQVTWQQAGRPTRAVDIREGGKVLICGGQRRTMLVIYPPDS